VIGLLDEWTTAAEIKAGRLFRREQRRQGLGRSRDGKLVWHVVKEFAAKIGVSKPAPHDLRRYAESQTMPNECGSYPFGVEMARLTRAADPA
jgi:hypothetical protein